MVIQLIKLDHIRKTFRVSKRDPGLKNALRGFVKRQYDMIEALADISFQVSDGEMVGYIGPNGAGKSTLMNMLGCLDAPTSGLYRLEGQDVSILPDRRLSDIRNRFIGFIFQGFHLIPGLSALENVELPLMYQGMGRDKRRRLAAESLERVGLGERLRPRPAEMSGGQQQRVAIARAIAARPPLILADEPTGNLDSRSGEDIMATLHELNREGHTIILITHDRQIAAQAQRLVRIRDGRIVS